MNHEKNNKMREKQIFVLLMKKEQKKGSLFNAKVPPNEMNELFNFFFQIQEYC